jgi:hypothetical protein
MSAAQSTCSVCSWSIAHEQLFSEGLKGTFSVNFSDFSATFLPMSKDRPQRWDLFEHWRKGDWKYAFLKSMLVINVLEQWPTGHLFHDWWKQVLWCRIWSRLRNVSICSRPLWKCGSAAISECCFYKPKRWLFSWKFNFSAFTPSFTLRVPWKWAILVMIAIYTK